MKVASFTVHATAARSIRSKRAAEAEGHRSAGSWLAAAADVYLKVRAKAGLPLPLAWRLGRFSVRLEGGELVTLNGKMSPPFGAFSGTADGPASYAGSRRHTLVHLPDARIIATLRSFGQCQALASELAPVLLRGEVPDPARVIERHQRERLTPGAAPIRAASSDLALYADARPVCVSSAPHICRTRGLGARVVPAVRRPCRPASSLVQASSRQDPQCFPVQPQFLFHFSSL